MGCGACWVVNAREVKSVLGRTNTGRADRIWLAKVAERGMCRPSLVQRPEIGRLRDFTRYRRALVHEPTRAQQRVEKLLEVSGPIHQDDDGREQVACQHGFI